MLEVEFVVRLIAGEHPNEPTIGEIVAHAQRVEISDAAGRVVRWPGPTLGPRMDEVLAQIGHDAAEIAELPASARPGRDGGRSVAQLDEVRR